MKHLQHTRELATTRSLSKHNKIAKVSSAVFQLLGTSLRDGLATIRFTMTFGAAVPRSRPRVALVRCSITPPPAAVDLHGPPDLVTTTCDLPGSVQGCQLGGLDHDGLPSGPHEFHAIVPVGIEPREVELAVQVDVSVAGPRLLPSRGHFVHARMSAPWTVRLVLPADPGAAGLPEGQASPRRSGTRVRLCIAADIERYSRFRGIEALQAQDRFLKVMRSARAHAGIDESAVAADGEGDSQFAVLPAEIDESEVVPALVEGFGNALREVNVGRDEHSRLRLRLALDRGLLVRGSNGWVGTSTIAVHRLLDSPPLRDALKVDPVTDYALMASRTLYEDVISHGYGGLTPDEFTGVEIDLPQKGFSSRAWLFTPRR